jgi:glutaconyl-CoA/methylmalonyl-CoA decarboxylase subunit gamma
MRYFVTLGAREIPVDVTALSNGGFDVRVDGRPVSVDAADAGGALSLRIDGRIVDLVIDGSPPKVSFALLGPSGSATIETERTRADSSRRLGRGSRESQDFVVASMPGRIVRLLVSRGAEVEAGTPMIVIEAMKMENELRAGHAGKVAEVLVGPGDTVEGGAKLIRFE